ncbi:MAG: WD40/YVTN/BNR-like repeat-containing protein [Actinomycetota bacterium]
MADQTEILVGTSKGLFVLRGPRGGALGIAARQFAGLVVEYATRDPRTGVYYASVTSAHFGPRVWMTKDVEGEWEQTTGPAFPPDAGAAVERIWVITPGEGEGVVWAGVAPAALFRSGDGGRTWELNRAMWDEPSRGEWQPGAGGLCLHSICPWPGEPDKLAIGISAAGVWLTEDGGSSCRRGVKGIVPPYIPEDARENATDLRVHNMHRAPLRPERLWMQFHGGVYRSDDAGESWHDVGTGTGLPSDFGFPMVIDPADPKRAWVIPLTADVDRVTPDGKLRVFETRDDGTSWNPLTKGLPHSDAYLTVLRQAFCNDGGTPLGLYFGDKSGTVYASIDAGASWDVAAEHLPSIVSVRAS